MMNLYRNSIVKLCRCHKRAIPYIYFRQKYDSSSKTDVEDDELSAEPVKYSHSDASRWKSSQTFGRLSESEKPPPSQLTMTLLSLAAILIYFCVLREENDLDDLLRANIFDQIPGLKEKHELHLQSIEKLNSQKLEENSSHNN